MATTIINEEGNTTISNENYGSGEIENKKASENGHLDHDLKATCANGTNMTSNLLELHTSRTSSPCGLGNTYLKEVIASLHRATMVSTMSSIAIRDAALVSLVHIVESENTENICDNSSHASSASSCQYSLIVLQTWLDQFARTNGGSSPSEYAGVDRVRLLHTLKVVVDKMEVLGVAQDNVALCAAVGRVINMATEEMTRTTDIIDEIQQPCSEVLVRLCRARPNGCGNKSGGGSYIERVVEAVMTKFLPGIATHYYVITTLSAIAVVNPIGMVPFLKQVLNTCLSNMKTAKKENLKYAYATALTRFSEAILDYEANIQDAPDQSVHKLQFKQEFDLAHEMLFSSWLGTSRMDSGNFQTRYAVMEALGQMGPLLSDERIYKNTTQVVHLLITLYKRSGIEPYYVTQCISSLLKAIVDRNSAILDGIVEQLLTALFVQLCQYCAYSTSLSPSTVSEADSGENSSETVDSKRRNHYEVLRCYDVLVKSHGEKLITGLIARLSSSDETVRLAGLTAFKHLMNTSMESLQSRMQSDIFTTLHSRLGENSNRVRKMLAQLTALLARLGYLEGEKGRDFLVFIVKLCALPVSAEGQTTCDSTGRDSSASNLKHFFSDLETTGVSNATLRDMCDNILQLLTNNVDAMEAVLWPHLLEYLLSPDYVGAVPSVIKSAAQLAQRKRKTLINYMVDWTTLDNVAGPYVLFARLLVLAAVPFQGGRGAHILSFLQHFAPNISKHLSALWDQRIPLLQHYLETHTAANGSSTSSWNQIQWEEWLLALLDNTIAEIDLDDWTSALATAMVSQMNLFYQSSNHLEEKCFLLRCLGRVCRASKSGALRIMENLAAVFAATQHSDELQVKACSRAFGYCASKHLKLVLEKLESLLTEAGSGKRTRGPSFFANLLRDTKGENIAILARCTILTCIGEVAIHADQKGLYNRMDEVTQKFVMPALKAAHPNLKLSALKATAEIAKSMEKVERTNDDQLGKENNNISGKVSLVHHNDLIVEGIECMKAKNWQLKEKQVALETTLALIRLPPNVNQIMRCSLLKACFTAVFPTLLNVYRENMASGRKNQFESTVSDVIRNSASTATLRKVTPPLQSALSASSLVTTSLESCDPNLLILINQILDTLLTLVQELLLQDLQQSTLDEIFTLVEPYLKLGDPFPREMAVTILSKAVHVFLEKYPFKVASDNNDKLITGESSLVICETSFAPGPYIAGCLVPRCFDTSRHVQATALQSLYTLLKVMIKFEKKSVECENDSSERKQDSAKSGMREMECALDSLKKIQNTCKPMTSSIMNGVNGNNQLEAVSPDIVSQILSDVLRLTLSEDQLLPLIHGLIEGLQDEVAVSARGTSLILGSLLESRGDEEDIKAQTTVLVGKLHTKLLLLQNEETKQRTLTAIRVIAAFNPKAVVTSLLADHQLPYDEAMISIWKVFSENCGLASVVMNHLITLINASDDSLVEENQQSMQTVTSNDPAKAAKHTGLAAVIALGTMFLTNEMETVIENEFSEVFVPILLSLGRYAGVKHYEQLNVTSINSSTDSSIAVPETILPYSAALGAMKNFLNRKRCASVTLAINNSCKDLSCNEYYKATNSDEYANFVQKLIESIIADFPQYLTKLARYLQPVIMPKTFAAISTEDARRAMLSKIPSHRVAASAFFSQILKSDSEMDIALMEIAIDALLNTYQDQIALIRIICLKGLSAPKLISSVGKRGKLSERSDSILEAFLNLIGDDYETDVNLYALTGLSKILSGIPLEVVSKNARQIVMKIFPFFDNCRKRRDSAASMECFASLAQFTLDHLYLERPNDDVEKDLSAVIRKSNIFSELKQIFIELTHHVLVSLILHSNDDGADDKIETRNASRKALENIFLIFKGNKHLDNVREWFLKENVVLHDVANSKNKRTFNYIDFLKEFCRTDCTPVTDMFPVHVNTTLNYFRIGDARLRYNAVNFITLLLVEGSTFKNVTSIDDWIEHGIDPESVCTAMAKLLSDPDTDVRTVASANIGKIFVVLGPKKLGCKSSPPINSIRPFSNVTDITEDDSDNASGVLENGID